MKRLLAILLVALAINVALAADVVVDVPVTVKDAHVAKMQALVDAKDPENAGSNYQARFIALSKPVIVAYWRQQLQAFKFETDMITVQTNSDAYADGVFE